MPRFTLGLLVGLTVTAATTVATLAVAHDRGWTLPSFGFGDQPREPGPVTVVLQRGGGTTYAALDDAPELNLSGILSRQGIPVATVPPFAGSDAEWTRFVGCVQERFDGFAVDVVDEVPSEGDYTLAFIGGTPDLIGYSENVGGIAPHAGRVLENSVVFVFQPKGTSLRSLCETAAHEIGHTLGLDHSRECSDIMSYESCGPKEFRPVVARCGEWEDRSCDNGDETQSSTALLAAAVGRRPVTRTPEVEPEPEPPRVASAEIEVRRSAEAAAGRPFSIHVDVGDREVEHVDLFWYAQRGNRLRCGEAGPIPFTCERHGSVYTFTLRPQTGGARKFVARVTETNGQLTRTPGYRVVLER